MGRNFRKKNILRILLYNKKCPNCFVDIFLFYFFKKKEIKSVTQNIAQEPLTDKQEDAFRSLKEKGDLKTEYQRILDGTDEK